MSVDPGQIDGYSMSSTTVVRAGDSNKDSWIGTTCTAYNTTLGNGSSTWVPRDASDTSGNAGGTIAMFGRIDYAALKHQLGAEASVSANLQNEGLAVVVRLPNGIVADDATLRPLIDRAVAEHFHERVNAVLLVRASECPLA